MRRAKAARKVRRGGARLVQVVNLHGTPRTSADAFCRQVDWLCENFSLIDFETLASYLEGGEAAPSGDDRLALLLTFDDGLASNHEVAAPILEAAGVHAVFFIVPGFSQCQGEEARRFFSERIAPGTDATRLPEELWKPMSPDQVAELAARGHTIANHTYSHAHLASLPPSEQQREIVEGAELLRTWTEERIDAFGWTFAWNAIDATAWRVARDTHRFCFAPCPGTVEVGVDSPALIWRANIEPSCAPHEYRFICSGLANPFWAKRRRRLRDQLVEVDRPELEAVSA